MASVDVVDAEAARRFADAGADIAQQLLDLGAQRVFLVEKKPGPLVERRRQAGGHGVQIAQPALELGGGNHMTAPGLAQ